MGRVVAVDLDRKPPAAGGDAPFVEVVPASQETLQKPGVKGRHDRLRDGAGLVSLPGRNEGLDVPGPREGPFQRRRPARLTAYGGFAIKITPYFLSSNFVLLEHGGAIAVPNLRGGAEYAEA